MKGRWESNANNWFPFMYVFTEMKLSSLLIPKTELHVMFCLPITTLIYLWEIYIFPGSVCLFCCSYGQILGIYNLLTDTWMRKLGLRPRTIPRKGTHKWDCCCSAFLRINHSRIQLCFFPSGLNYEPAGGVPAQAELLPTEFQTGSDGEIRFLDEGEDIRVRRASLRR